MVKNFRKLSWVVFVLSLSMLLALTACSSSSQQVETEQPEGQTEQVADAEKKEDKNEEVATPEKRDLILSTTTSTQDSGLLDVLLPIFEEQTGYNVKTIAVGTGQALAMGEKGEADVLLTHAPAAEKEIEEKGAVFNRQRVMYNDFIIVGPTTDPASVLGMTVEDGFKQIAETGSLFVSRGDDSGTHKKELAVWKLAETEIEGQDWYIESGQGMGATLQIAAEREAYTLTDRATYLALKDTLGTLDILLEGDESLLNIYHVMQVNPELNAMINSAGAEAFVAFMIAPETQEVIGTFGVEEYGQNLFFPDAE